MERETMRAESLGACPIPPLSYRTVLLGHGSGGRLMHELIEKVFRPLLLPPDMRVLNDAAVMTVDGLRLAFTTDAFVVDPIVFPGGDIGRLAVNGTINDLAVSGARPLFLSAAFILEEGLPIETLCQIVDSMRQAAAEAGVPIVTGDTKAVNRGKADKIFITTTGLGVVEYEGTLSADQARPGDVVLLNGRGDAGPGPNRVRTAHPIRHRAASHPGGRHAPRQPPHPLHARRHPRRPGQRPQRDRHELPRGHPAGRSAHPDPG
jgi:hydrogenase expression/formation protein HypE